MTTHSSLLAWEIPWTEDTGGKQSMGQQRVGHDRAPDFHFFTSQVLITDLVVIF